MAINKSNKPVNTIRERYERESSQQSSMGIQAQIEAARYRSKYQELSREFEDAQDDSTRAHILTRMSSAEESADMWQARAKERRQLVRIGAYKQAASSFERLSRPETIGTEINKVAGSVDAYSASMQMKGSYAELEQQRLGHIQAAQKASQRMSGIFETDMPADKKWEKLEREQAIRQGAISQAGALDIRMNQLRKMGMDPMSRDQRFEQVASRASATLREQGIADQVGKGDISGIGRSIGMESINNAKEVLAAFTEVQKRIVDTQKKLASETDKGSKSAEIFRKQLDKLTNQSNVLSETMKQIQVQGVGGGRMSAVAQGLGMFSAAGGQVIGALRDTIVNQPTEMRGMQAEFAALGNQQYRDFTGAVGGDMKSLMMLQSWQRMRSAGNNAFYSAQSVESGQLGINAAATTGDVLSKLAEGASLGNLGGSTAMKTAEATAMGIGGASQAIANSARLGRGLPGGRASLQRMQAVRGLLSNVNDIQAGYLQQYRDFEVGGAQSLRGFGAGAAGFLDQMRAQRGGAAEIGVGAEQFNQINAAGIQGLGRDFQAADVIRLRQLERTGMGNIEQNMQRRGALQMLGAGSQSDLEEIMKIGVEKGLNSSKAIDMMVQATTASAQRLSDMGYSVGKETAGMIAMAAGADSPVEIRRAQAAMEFVNQNAGATNMSMVSLMERQQIGATFGNRLDLQQTTNLQGATPQQIAALRHIARDNATEAEKNRGYDVAMRLGFTKKEAQDAFTEGNLNSLLAAKTLKVATGGKFGLMEMQEDQRKLMESIVTNKDPRAAWNSLNEDQRAKLYKLGSGSFDMEKVLMVASGRAGTGAGATLGGGVLPGERIGEQAARLQSKQIEEGRKTLGGDIKAFSDVMEKLTDSFDAEEWSQIPAKMADSLSVIKTDFGIHTTNFGRAVKRFEDAVMGGDFTGTKGDIEKLTSNIEKMSNSVPKVKGGRGGR